MITEKPGPGKGLFPEIRIYLWTKNRSVQLSLPAGFQIIGATALFTVVFGFYHLVAGHIASDRIIAALKATVVRAEAANAGLRDEVTRLKRKLALATDELQHSQGETARPPGLASPFRLAGLITTEIDKLADDPLQPDVALTEPPTEPESQSAAEIARHAIGELHRLLGSTGLNIERLFPQLGQSRAVGGPFVPPPKGEPPPELSLDRLEAVHSLIKSLPLSTPLDYYQLVSRFGLRRDPFNRRLAFHTGIDLSAPYMSPVYATAAGVVTYAGYSGDYGKVVEIDHDNGVATIYAHLQRYTVSVGRKVAEHEQIGNLGSTGRSSGPHVHYEVRVNDEPQDPEKFIGLARVIAVTRDNE
jgi:murein DD-endopeptidase MepM/ murein hydrolase activator NlpD